MQNVDHANGTTFQPVIYSVNLRLFSFVVRSKTEIAHVEYDEVFDRMQSVESVDFLVTYSSPEKMECYARGRRLPDILTQDVLLQEVDFSFTFSVFGQDMAYINRHEITYQPEEGEDLLRI